MSRIIKPLVFILIMALALCFVACAEAVSIASIEKTGTEGRVDTYTIYYSNGQTYTFTVTNGADGANGTNGINGTNGTDGHTPTLSIGENGNWYIDGEDTGICAEGKNGENGDNGNTPTIEISTDGYWVINGEKTEYKATGANGTDGKTPTIEISTDGYWIINGEKTPHRAVGTNGTDGKAPTVEISTDGYWIINGKKTEHCAVGKNGENGKDGVTPKFKLDGATLLVSYDDGKNWEELGTLSGEEEAEKDVNIVITKDDIEEGGYANGQKRDDAKRLRINRLIEVTKGTVITYKSNGMQIYINNLLSEDDTAPIKSNWLKNDGEYTVERDGYLAIIFANADNKTEITLDNYTAEMSINIKSNGNSEPESPKPVHRDRLIYEFGGEGNDWCFVYLPEDYDEAREEPFPLVICNHGNGWNMNGTPEKANWTDIGMYVPTDYSGLSGTKKDRYIPTEDSTLWYSNATIEALLDAGYVVAGAQNYGDSLYGNDNCRNAVVDFYDHMVKTYNVKEECYMIGASNGAMSTLGAVSILGEKVKAIILQYPLTCLVNQYFANSTHAAQMRTAYGITDENITREELTQLLLNYDPLTTNVQDGKKQGYFPATKIYYSMDDTTTKATNNALPFYELLVNSGKEVEKQEAEGNHGDLSHFNPEEYVLWFESHK